MKCRLEAGFGAGAETERANSSLEGPGGFALEEPAGSLGTTAAADCRKELEMRLSQRSDPFLRDLLRVGRREDEH